jgi:hypothetical protein
MGFQHIGTRAIVFMLMCGARKLATEHFIAKSTLMV